MQKRNNRMTVLLEVYPVTSYSGGSAKLLFRFTMMTPLCFPSFFCYITFVCLPGQGSPFKIASILKGREFALKEAVVLLL